MMSISPPISASQASHYHQEHFASKTERYYSEGDGSAQGVWRGKLAAELGLSGAIVREDFLAIAEGRDPHTGAVLVRDRGKTKEYTNVKGQTVKPVAHRAAFDAQFAPPKSVSVQSVFDRRLVDVHNRAVEFAVREALEPYTQARVKSHRAHTTSKGVFAVFQHDSARPVDGFAAPQLHSHVLVMNVAAANGKTYALQPEELYKAQTLAGAVYDSFVAREAMALGYELERGAGSWEIKGYTRAFIDEMSKRSEAIHGYMKERGLTGAKAADIAARATRQGKDESQTPEVMRTETLRLAAQYGIDPVAMGARAEKRQVQVIRTADLAWKSAHASLTYAREKLFEREAVNGERKLIAEALKRSMGGAGLEEVRGALLVRRGSGEFVALGQRGMERLVTTRRMLDMEASNLARMQAMQDLGVPLASVKLPMLESLSGAQQRAVGEILASPAGITALEARAGTGKTSRVLAAVKGMAEADGYVVMGIAPTSGASKELRRAGIDSMTLQKFLLQSKAMGEQKRLLILDEASLASTRNMNELLNRIGPYDRLLVCGDSRQHEAVEAGSAFAALQRAGVKTVRLEEIMRQQDPELKRAVELLAEGNTKWAVGELLKQGRVTEVANGRERLVALAKDFARAPEGTLAIAPSNEERAELNRAIRKELQSSGIVSEREHKVKVLAPRNELTGAERSWAARYDLGNVVRYSTGSRKLGIKAGEYARVVDVSQAGNLLTVQRATGQVITYDPQRLQGVAAFKEAERLLGAGDRVQLTAPFNEKRIANRELATVEKIDSGGNLALRLDSGQRVRFNLREHPCVDYGYAVTSHSSQGATADRVLILVDSQQSKQLVNERMAYVSVSRAASDVRIYTDSAAVLVSKLGREHSKPMALDFDLSQAKSTVKQQEKGQEQSFGMGMRV